MTATNGLKSIYAGSNSQFLFFFFLGHESPLVTTLISTLLVTVSVIHPCPSNSLVYYLVQPSSPRYCLMSYVIQWSNQWVSGYKLVLSVC